MRVLALVLSALVGGPAHASALCDQFFQEGRTDLGSACLLDESYHDAERARRRQEDDVQRYLDRQQQETDRILRNLELDNRYERRR